MAKVTKICSLQLLTGMTRDQCQIVMFVGTGQLLTFTMGEFVAIPAKPSLEELSKVARTKVTSARDPPTVKSQ